MSAWDKACLTAVLVAVVLGVARRLGPRAAGVVAGLPVISGLAMAWLAHDAGAAFAADTAIAGVAILAMLAGFALVYAHVAHRAGVWAALVAGAAGAGLLAAPALIASRQWSAAMVLGIGGCVAVLKVLPTRVTDVRPAAARARVTTRRMPSALATVLTAAGAAAISALATSIGPVGGAFAAGLVASLPVASACVAATEQASGGHPAMAEFLRGFVLGLLGRAAFGAVFALAVRPLGLPLALALAFAAALASTSVATALQRKVSGAPGRGTPSRKAARRQGRAQPAVMSTGSARSG